MREILQALGPYASAPPADAPPEILCWDPADAWGVDGAARAALGLLLEGEQPGDRLFEVADYLLAFCTAGFHKNGFADATLLNGTALALCGYLSQGEHPEAETWRMTGCARLATELHQRRAAVEDRTAADCLLAICRAATWRRPSTPGQAQLLRCRCWRARARPGWRSHRSLRMWRYCCIRPRNVGGGWPDDQRRAIARLPAHHR